MELLKKLFSVFDLKKVDAADLAKVEKPQNALEGTGKATQLLNQSCLAKG